jgi:hypothetical protein
MDVVAKAEVPGHNASLTHDRPIHGVLYSIWHTEKRLERITQSLGYSLGRANSGSRLG